MTALNWEEIDRDDGGDDQSKLVTERAAVPGGWLVRSYVESYNGRPMPGVGLTFVPDEDAML